jgi:hypothetical protein
MLQETFRNQATKQILTTAPLATSYCLPKETAPSEMIGNVDFGASAIQVLPKQVMKILQIFP